MPITYTKERIAKVVIEQNGHKFNLEIRRGNCLGVVIHRSTDADGKATVMLYSFFSDRQHLKNIVAAHGTVFSDKVVSIKMNMKFKESYELLPFFMDSGYKVTCYKK